MSERDFRKEAVNAAVGYGALLHGECRVRIIEEIERRLRAEAALEELKAENTRLGQERMRSANDLNDLRRAAQAVCDYAENYGRVSGGLLHALKSLLAKGEK